MEKTLSLIIPTYNMEKYLDKCLGSLLVDAWGMERLEVLVVNDGSKDRSLSIARGYESRYPGVFRVIDKENGNYGSCINRGIREATGKYVKVLDADDYFDNTQLRDVLRRLVTLDADLILTDFQCVNSEGTVTSTHTYTSQGVEAMRMYDITSFMDEHPSFYGQMHGFMYRLSMVKEMGYKQTEGISYTDQEWVAKPITRVLRIYYIDSCLYCYLLGREGQTMDRNALMRSMPQLMKVVHGICLFHEEGDFDRPVFSRYIENQMKVQLRVIYSEGLLEHSYDLNLLVEFDSLIATMPVFYQVTDSLARVRLRYVRHWRHTSHKRLTWPYLLSMSALSFISSVRRRWTLSK